MQDMFNTIAVLSPAGQVAAIVMLGLVIIALIFAWFRVMLG